MTVQEVAKRVMRDRGLSQAEVAMRANMKGQSAVAMLLQGKSMRVDSLLKILDACGYELIVQDKEGCNFSYRISIDEEEEDILKEEKGKNIDEKIEKLVKMYVDEELKRRGL